MTSLRCAVVEDEPEARASLRGWLALVRWRTSRHRVELWKSLVLPAAGTTLCWLLLMTLWLPLLDHGRSYGPLLAKLQPHLPAGSCVHSLGLSNAQNAALLYHGQWRLRAAAAPSADCAWLVTSTDALPQMQAQLQAWGWSEAQRQRRPSDNKETLVIFQPAAR